MKPKIHLLVFGGHAACGINPYSSPMIHDPPERIDYYSPIPPAKVLRKAKQTTKKKGKRK